MTPDKQISITEILGKIPFRMAFAGGWIDQPFVSRLNPEPPGSMVVVAIEPDNPFMNRSGMGTSTRNIAMKLWNSDIPERDPAVLVRELYEAENQEKHDPSGSQDMAGILYPGINRLDYDFNFADGYFPSHVQSCNDRNVADWLEKHVSMLPVCQRPTGYNPLEEKHLDPVWIRRLGQSGAACFDAILARDPIRLGESMNESMLCWEHILPNTVRHRTIKIDLLEILDYYQSRYFGAMYSGCGGGYIYVVSEEPVPGSFRVRIRTAQ